MLKVGMEEDDDEETDRKYDEYRERNAKNADERNVKGAVSVSAAVRLTKMMREEDDYNAGGQYVQNRHRDIRFLAEVQHRTNRKLCLS